MRLAKRAKCKDFELQVLYAWIKGEAVHIVYIYCWLSCVAWIIPGL